jgi:hypothetical protein
MSLPVGMDVTIPSVALPSIQADLHAGMSGLQWIVDAYTLVARTSVPGLTAIQCIRGNMGTELQNPERRTFLRAGATVAAAGLATAASQKKVLGANDRLRIAVFGLRGRGWDHVKGYQPIPNVEIAYFCDVDESVLAKRCSDAEKLGIAKPKTYVDVRKLLEDKNVDAVSIATPNHWHSLMGIWAAQAGKDI